MLRHVCCELKCCELYKLRAFARRIFGERCVVVLLVHLKHTIVFLILIVMVVYFGGGLTSLARGLSKENLYIQLGAIIPTLVVGIIYRWVV